MDLPILVEQLTPRMALTLACAHCGFERQATDDEILIEELCPCPKCAGVDPHGGRFYLEWKYEAADRCKGCGRLGFYSGYPVGCCSRVCMLQAEYAEELRARRER